MYNYYMQISEQEDKFVCEECDGIFSYRKTLARHVRDVHGMDSRSIEKKMTCGCGREFENTRYSGGPRKGGPRQKHCSYECTQKATNVRYYGLSLAEYYDLLKRQDMRCAICKKHVDEELRFLAVDHEHVSGFEEMSPQERKKLIRGLLCILCNKHRMASIDLQIAEAMVHYLRSYQSRMEEL